MTPRAKARTCTAAALLFLTAGIAAPPSNPGAGIAGIAGAVILWAAARSYRRQHWAMVFRCEQARRAAIAFPDPAPMPDYDRAAEQARYDATFGDMISHWNEDAA